MTVPIKTVRIVAQQHNNAWPTVNVSTSPHPQSQWKTYTQAPKGAPQHEYPTFQAGLTGAGPFRNGLTTIYVPGYTGPA